MSSRSSLSRFSFGPARAGASSVGLLVGLGGVLAALALGWWFTGGTNPAGERIDGDRIVSAERRDLIDAVTASGRVEPIARVAVMSRASGIVKELLVDEGDIVKTGQVLVELDREQLEVTLAQDEADLLSAEARVAAAQASLEEARLQLDDPELAFLERDAARKQQLFDQGSVSLEAREDSARMAASARFRLEMAHARVPVLGAALEGAKADLAASRAALERSRTALREATIKSPIDGVVLTRDKEVGDGVSSILTAGGNATQILSLGDLSRMHVEARVDEVDLGRIQNGMLALVTVDAHRGKRLNGRVERIAPAGSIDNNGIVTFEVKIVVEDPDGLLKPDMTADAKLVIARRDAALTLPQRALRRDPDGNWIALAVTGAEGREHTEERAVEIGLSDGLQTEILSGLEEGERVLVPEAGPARRP